MNGRKRRTLESLEVTASERDPDLVDLRTFSSLVAFTLFYAENQLSNSPTFDMSVRTVGHDD